MFSEDEQPQINLAGLEANSDQRRRRQGFLLFVVMLAALIAVGWQYREYWLDSFLPEQTAEPVAPPDANAEAQSHPRSKPARKGTARSQSASALPAERVAAESSQAHATVLPALRVDVTYGWGLHQTLLARNSAVQVNMDRAPDEPLALPAPPPAPEAVATAGSETVTFSPQTVEVVVRPVEPVYPPLAQQSNVQGSVVLRARINKEGGVQSLQVVSGPDILTTAALEAVRQWRFKPHFEAGQAVPTETQITVNFTISTP